MTVCRLFGVRIVLNPFFLLLLMLFAYTELLVEALLLFGTVLLHEGAHGVVARMYGLGVREIELLPFGGVARLEGLIEWHPGVEVVVALSGPLVNFAVVGLLLGPLARWVGDGLQLFLHFNLWIGALNLLPALPLDGGRILRAFASRYIGYRRATRLAVRLARIGAFILIAAGLYVVYGGSANVSPIVVGLFLLFATAKEERQAAYVFLRYLSRKRREYATSDCVRVHHLTAGEKTPLKAVVHSFLPARFHMLWVRDAQGRIVQFIPEGEIIDAFFERGADTAVGELGGVRR